MPVYKKNDKTDVGNYRPVAILTTISEIHVLERVEYDQVESYLTGNSLLYGFPSGFRSGLSQTHFLFTYFITFVFS